MTELTLVLGSKITFPGCKRGSWALIQDKGRDGKEWNHVPGETKIRVPEKVADGLISASKEWEANNKRRNVKGDVRRMIKVKDIERNVEQDPGPATKVIGIEALKMFADALGDRLTENMQTLNTTKKTPPRGGSSKS